MEVTNDRIMGAFKLQTPLRAYISGSSDMLAKGKPAIAIAINRYTKGLIQVYEIASTVIKKEIRFIIRSANQIVVDYTIKSMWEVLDLNLEDMKEIKLIKHVLRNEPSLQNEVKAMFREKTTHFQRTISIKMECDLPINLGLGSSAGYCLTVASGIVIGLKIAFNQITDNDTFTTQCSKDDIQKYADYLEDLISDTASGLDVAIGISGGIIAFVKSSEDKNQVLALDASEFNFSLIMVNANTPKRTVDSVKSVEGYQKSEELDSLSDQICTAFIESQYETTIPELLSQQQNMQLQAYEVDQISNYDELKEITDILSENGYSSCINGQVLIGLTSNKDSDCEARVQSELKKRYYTLYGKVGLSLTGICFKYL